MRNCSAQPARSTRSSRAARSDANEEKLQQRAVAAAKAALGEDAFAAAWAGGEAMTPEEIVQLDGIPIE